MGRVLKVQVAEEDSQPFGTSESKRGIYCEVHVAGERLFRVATGQFQVGARSWLCLMGGTRLLIVSLLSHGCEEMTLVLEC
jgi:hypothetical protein